VVGGLAIASMGIARSARAAAPSGGSIYASRAQATYAALQRYFYDPATSFYLQTYPRTGANPWSYVWPFTQAMCATQVMAGLPAIGRRYRRDVLDRYRALDAYWNIQTTPPRHDSYLVPPYGQGGTTFYDDNEWIALGFLQRHTMARNGDSAALRRAGQIFDLVIAAWDTDPDHPDPGGVFWSQNPANGNRNTVSNAPGAEVGLHLYLATREPRYLEWSIRMYEWVRHNMLASNGLYWDHIDLAGTVDTTQWSYNQGVMIGAGLLLYRATGKPSYLSDARDTAAAALTYYADDERYFTQPAQFNAIFFSNLLQLWVDDPDPAYRRAMRWYADESYRRFHDPVSGLYRFNGTNPVPLLDQAAMARIEGMLAWTPNNYRTLT
jgi:predicted alpha-1,6-mannanase (GH76 family)